MLAPHLRPVFSLASDGKDDGDGDDDDNEDGSPACNIALRKLIMMGVSPSLLGTSALWGQASTSASSTVTSEQPFSTAQ